MNEFVVTGEPKTGKTRTLIDWIAEEVGEDEYRVLLVESERTADILRRKYNQFNRDRFRSVNGPFLGNRNEDGKRLVYAVDDANLILSRILGAADIRAMALAGDWGTCHMIAEIPQ